MGNSQLSCTVTHIASLFLVSQALLSHDRRASNPDVLGWVEPSHYIFIAVALGKSCNFFMPPFFTREMRVTLVLLIGLFGEWSARHIVTCA